MLLRVGVNLEEGFDDTKFTKQLKAAAILNEEAKKNPTIRASPTT